MTRLAILALALSLSTAACAETRVYVSGVPYLCDDAYHQVGCRKDWRTIKRQKVRHREPEVRAWKQEDEPRQDCRPPVSVVGSEHLNEATSKDAAERAWRGQVRYLHGERYMNLEKAYRLKMVCTRSSTGDSVTAKALDSAPAKLILGEDAGVLHRCQIEARPCSVEPEEVGK